MATVASQEPSNIDWTFLSSKGHPFPTNGKPFIIPHLLKLASRSRELLEQQRRPSPLLDTTADEELLERTSSNANLPSLRAAYRYSKAFATLKNGGLFDAPSLAVIAKGEAGPSPELWDNLRIKYEQLSGTLVDDAIADKFRGVTCRAFDNDHAEWEKEKVAFLKQFELHVNKLHDISVDQVLLSSSAFPKRFQRDAFLRGTHGMMELSSEHAYDAEFRFLQWLYEGGETQFSIDFPVLLNTAEAMFPSLPELKDIWKLVYIYGRLIRDHLSLGSWILNVILLLEIQAYNLQQESFQALKNSAVFAGAPSFKGIERLIAYLELTCSPETERYSHHWYWKLAYTAFRCGNTQSLLELCGISHSPIFSLENQPPEFTTVCKALSHRLYSAVIELMNGLEGKQDIPDQLLDESTVNDLALSSLSLTFKVSDNTLDPYLRLLLSLINSNIWPPISISQISQDATQEDYMWYKFRLALLFKESESNEMVWAQKLRNLSSKVRDLGAAYFGGFSPVVDEADPLINTQTLSLGYSRMLMYTACFGEALYWMQEHNPALERVSLLFMMYLINCEAENREFSVVDIPQYAQHSQLLEKMFVRGLRNASLPVKFLYLKTIPKSESFRVFQCLVTDDFNRLISDDVLGKYSAEGKLQQGELADMIIDDGDRQASEAMLHGIYKTIGGQALHKGNLDVAFRCFYFAEDEHLCTDVLERMLTDATFDYLKKVTQQEQALLELYLIYYEFAMEKWKYGRVGILTRMYERASFYYMVLSGNFLRALEWFQSRDLLPIEELQATVTPDDPYVLIKLIPCYAYCLSQLSNAGDFQSLQVAQRYVPTKQLELLLQHTNQLYQYEPKRLSQANAVFKEFLNMLTVGHDSYSYRL